MGSANLSGAALTGGLEWTVKLTQRAQEALFARAIAHFETLWADSEFQRYDPDNVEHRQALASALGRESFGGDPTGAISFFDLQPKTYQQDMLEQLSAERAHGRHRNLLVAPTGTGKHAATGKAFHPLAPAANAERFTNAAKTEKWFRRNCNDVLGRECSAGEKADVLAWLMTLK